MPPLAVRDVAQAKRQDEAQPVAVGCLSLPALRNEGARQGVHLARGSAFEKALGRIGVKGLSGKVEDVKIEVLLVPEGMGVRSLCENSS